MFNKLRDHIGDRPSCLFHFKKILELDRVVLTSILLRLAHFTLINNVKKSNRGGKDKDAEKRASYQNRVTTTETPLLRTATKKKLAFPSLISS